MAALHRFTVFLLFCFLHEKLFFFQNTKKGYSIAIVDKLGLVSSKPVFDFWDQIRLNLTRAELPRQLKY